MCGLQQQAQYNGLDSMSCWQAQLPAHTAIRTSEAEQRVGAVGGAANAAGLQLLHDRVCLRPQHTEHARLAADVHQLHLQVMRRTQTHGISAPSMHVFAAHVCQLDLQK